MAPTTFDMERTAVMPMAAPVGVVVGSAPVFIRPIHASGIAPLSPTMDCFGGYLPVNAVKPWTTGNDRQVNQGTIARPARNLGSVST